ncbi:MAG: diguanylate cyclase [Desulfovibrio sp.]
MSGRQDRQRILIVDDVASNVRMLGDALIAEHDVSVATNGEDALNIINSGTPPDLILLDIMMPRIDGYEVCRRLKANDQTKAIPVIFITAKTGEDDETLSFELGAADYIRKPFSMPIVMARIKIHLELKKHRDMLENLSTLDGLTGIPNRRRFDDALQSECRRAKRLNNFFSLLMIDIDHFKAYNDNYGHIAGDEALKAVASTLEASVRRPTDLVARYGGEEFGVILPETDLAGAMFIAEVFQENIHKLNIPHAYSAVGDRVTISQGVVSVQFPCDISSLEIVDAADKMLYAAKNGGRDQFKGESLETYCRSVGEDA